MTTLHLRDRLAGLVADDPPMHADLDLIMTAGRRSRRRRRLGGSFAAVAVTGVAAVAATLVAADPAGDAVTVVPFAALGSQASATPVPGPTASGLTPMQQRIVDAVRAASPRGWTFETGADRWSGNPGVQLEATADDGTAPGRLLLGVTTRPGYQQVHPCRDEEFRAGASCTERTLPDGSVVSRRGVVDYTGIRTILVVLSHPDGTGVAAESGNFTLVWPLPDRLPADVSKSDILRVTRPGPTYTLDQLERVVLAVDRALPGG
jgi:hypothetical protein